MKPYNPSTKILLVILALALAALGCLKQKTQIDPRNFSIDQCSCPGMALTFIEGTSSASNNTYLTTIPGFDDNIEIKGRLTCVWQEEYQSDQKVGLISANLEVVRIQEEAQAKALYKQYKEQVVPKPDYCEEDNHCYVREYDAGPERIMYAEQNTYSGDQGEDLPSYHNAHLVMNIYGPNDHYVVNLTVSHPELDPGSNYVIDKAAAIEACLQPLAGK